MRRTEIKACTNSGIQYQDRDRGTGGLRSSCSLASQVLLWRSTYMSLTYVAGGRKRAAMGSCIANAPGPIRDTDSSHSN